MAAPVLTRTLKVGCVGKDVEACKRAVYRYLHAGGQWNTFVRSAPVVRRTYGVFFRTAVKHAQARLRLPQTGTICPRTYAALRQAHAFDALADDLLRAYQSSTRPKVCYPHPAGQGGTYGPLHPTEGLPGNWAVDFMAAGGTPVLASFDGRVTRFSGHDPASGVIGGDIFGWSIYLEAKDGRTAFITHLGSRSCTVGQTVRCGHMIGTVGHWPHDPGRSHTHEGISSPFGSADAKQRILDIARAAKLPAS